MRTAQYFGRLERDIVTCLRSARQHYSDLAHRLNGCRTRFDLETLLEPQVLDAIAGRSESQHEIIEELIPIRPLTKKVLARLCGYHLIPLAANQVVGAVRRGLLVEPVALCRPLALPTARPGCDEAHLREFWHRRVVPELKEAYPDHFRVESAGPWLTVRMSIAACRLLAWLISTTTRPDAADTGPNATETASAQSSFADRVASASGQPPELLRAADLKDERRKDRQITASTAGMAGRLSHPERSAGTYATAAAVEIEAAESKLLDASRAAEPFGDSAEAFDHRAALETMPKDARASAEAMLCDPNLIRHVQADIDSLGVAGEQTLALTVYLIGVSRRLRCPLAAIITGDSATGKSFVPSMVSRLFPDEAVIHVTRLTPQALYHMHRGSLSHRWIVGGERSRRESNETGEATRALREMLSSGRLMKLAPLKVGKKIETVQILQEGPIAFTESTTRDHIFAEDRNRCLLLATDEGDEQTRRIMQSQAAGRSTAGREVDALVRKHHALQRMLALVPASVLIPFASDLARRFPVHRPEARRAFGLALNMIEAVALLHHRQRERNEHGQIVATRADYEVARQLLSDPLGRALGTKVSDGAKRLFDRIAQWSQQTAFTSTQAYAREKYSGRQVRNWLNELVHAGFLHAIKVGRPGKAAHYRIAGPVNDDRDMAAPAHATPLPALFDVLNP